jgi:amphi-Trp domain-containing protein
MKKRKRDVDRSYPLPDFIAKLRRLADALEAEKAFAIQIKGERIRVPACALCMIEHERGDGEEEIAFEIRWKTG